MNWKEKLKTVLEALGFTSKFENKALTNEEFQQVVDAYQRDYKVTLQDDMNAEAQQAQSEQQQQLLNQIYAAVVEAGGEESGGEGEQQQQQQPATQEGIITAINNLGAKIHELAGRPAEDRPEQKAAAVIVSLSGFGNTPEYLFGAQHPMYSMDLRWNKIAANPGAAAALGVASEADERKFFQAAREYGASLMQRMQYLIQNGMLDVKALSEGQFSTNYAGVDGLGDMGSQFTVRRQDAIIARVLSTRQMTEFFPVRYGIQDNDVIFNAFFGEVSQAWQEGEVYKGSMKIENERGYVDDVMMKLKWGPMKELERKYIAYLNTSGSDPIKWNMIEYQLLNSLLVAQREQNIRRMRGIYVAPESGVAGSYLTGSTGILYRLIDYIHSNKLLVTEDSDKAVRSYTESTMLAVVKIFVDEIRAHLAEDETLDGKVLYLNERHKPWWLKCIRTQFHLDTDFAGVNSYANVVPDTEVPIIWLPYLGNLNFMMMQEPGNLQFLEFLPGEMMAVKTEQQMEMVRAWSTWKEGTSAAFVGRKVANKAALVANNYEFQQIFLNKPCASLAAGAVKADANNGFWFETGANESATAITDIDNAKAGVAYIIECGSTTNASTIAKDGKFSEIGSAWTPSAAGDYLMVILNAAGTKFLELERCVGGVRTINATLNPHYVG